MQQDGIDALSTCAERQGVFSSLAPPRPSATTLSIPTLGGHLSTGLSLSEGVPDGTDLHRSRCGPGVGLTRAGNISILTMLELPLAGVMIA